MTTRAHTHTHTQWVVFERPVICTVVSMCQFVLEVTITVIILNHTGGTVDVLTLQSQGEIVHL